MKILLFIIVIVCAIILLLLTLGYGIGIGAFIMKSMFTGEVDINKIDEYGFNKWIVYLYKLLDKIRYEDA